MRLEPDELDAALDLILQHGLSELLPRSFEVEALRASWPRIRDLLTDLDVSDPTAYEPHPALTLVSPKQRYAVRPVHILDPIDTLLYTAIVRRLAPRIEASRQPRKARTVFSFRFDEEQASTSFTMQRLWPDFVKRQLALCARFSHVAIADISDFFPNIYLHRLKNALDDATGMATESDVLIRWLAGWSPDGSRTSQGIPVGPLASNLLSEALLIEVDDYLRSRDRVFVRYVDDFRIFCRSEAEAVEVLHELGERLLIEERLSLNARKTTVITTAKLRKGLQSPRATLRAKRTRFIAEVQKGDPYAPVDWSELPAKAKKWVTGLNAKAMLADAMREDFLDAQKVSFALQVLRAVSDGGVVADVLQRLPRLAPVSRDIGTFLATLPDRARPDQLATAAAAVLKYLGDSHYKPAYQRVWLLEPFALRPEWNDSGQRDSALIRLLRSDTNVFVQRQAVLALAHSPRRGSRVDLKQYRNHASPWVRRAALYAGRHLAPDERDHGFRRLRPPKWTIANAIDQAVAELAARG